MVSPGPGGAAERTHNAWRAPGLRALPKPHAAASRASAPSPVRSPKTVPRALAPAMRVWAPATRVWALALVLEPEPPARAPRRARVVPRAPRKASPV